MQEIINNLYEMENFTNYITIAIAVLIVLFLIVLFLGKKDQKLEETKKLQKLEMDSFKETSAAVKAESTKISEETTSIPVLETSDLLEIKEEEIINSPIISQNKEEETLSVLQDLTEGNVELPKMKVEEKIVFPEASPLSEISQDESSEPISLSEISTQINDIELPKIKEEETFKEENNVETEQIVLPDLNFDDVISSLNEETKEVKSSDLEETMVIPPAVSELVFENKAPLEEVKEELIVPKKEEPIKKVISNPIFSSVYVPKKEDDIIDLTNIGAEEVINSPSKVESNPSFSAILGETYEINK